MPISVSRTMADGASLVCSVDSTRWPVSAASMAMWRGLLVADLAEQHDVGVRAQDRAQRRGEGQARLGVGLHLVDAGQPVLDRVLDGDDVDLGLADDVERRVQGGRLAGPVGPVTRIIPYGLTKLLL
jgi:hypothetical protein